MRVTDRVEVQLQIGHGLRRITAYEATALVHAHRERPASRGHIAQCGANLTNERAELIVQRRDRRAVKIRYGQMVLQVSPHRRAVMQRLDAECLQSLAITHARQLQQLRRIDRAARQHDLTACGHFDFAIALQVTHADGALALEEHARS